MRVPRSKECPARPRPPPRPPGRFHSADSRSFRTRPATAARSRSSLTSTCASIKGGTAPAAPTAARSDSASSDKSVVASTNAARAGSMSGMAHPLDRDEQLGSVPLPRIASLFLLLRLPAHLVEQLLHPGRQLGRALPALDGDFRSPAGTRLRLLSILRFFGRAYTDITGWCTPVQI